MTTLTEAIQRYFPPDPPDLKREVVCSCQVRNLDEDVLLQRQAVMQLLLFARLSN